MKTFMTDENKKMKLYKCPECGLEYQDPEWAKKCESWCKEHQSCNLDIIKYAESDSNF